MAGIGAPVGLVIKLRTIRHGAMDLNRATVWISQFGSREINVMKAESPHRLFEVLHLDIHDRR
jgi:hypothetical protein